MSFSSHPPARDAPLLSAPELSTKPEQGKEAEEQVKQDKKPIMYEGPAEVVDVRKRIVAYSLPRAKARVAAQKRKRENPEPGSFLLLLNY